MSPEVAAVKARVNDFNAQLNKAWAIESHPEALIALRRVEDALEKLQADATRVGVEITDFARTKDNIALLVAQRDRIQPGEGNTLVAIVDTETTGLAAHDEPIAIGVLLAEYTADKGDLVKEHQRLYMLREPSVPIHPKAQAVHGLSLEDLRGKAWDLPQLARALSSAEIVAAHNAKFDRSMVARVLPYSAHLQWACSLHALNREWSKFQIASLSLDALCTHFGIDRPAPHNALADVVALESVLKFRTGKTIRSRTLMGALISNPWSPPYAPNQ